MDRPTLLDLPPTSQQASTMEMPASLPSGSELLPSLIQGGMGIGVSNWSLARAVARHGQMGVISGTALATVFIRRLQDGDLGGHIRRALAACPLRDAVEKALRRYFLNDGRRPGQPYRALPMPTVDPSDSFSETTVLANFAEVYLAKEGHSGPVGINLLEKIQIPTLASLFGAMLAGVDYVLMGAGIPRSIPGALDDLAAGRTATLRLDILGAPASPDPVRVQLDPKSLLQQAWRELKRPRFLAVVSSSALATTLARKSNGQVDGFIVEGASAGGHNAPSRGGAVEADGEPLYGPRDVVDLAAIRALGKPFWLAGSYADASRLASAKAEGAQGVQLGTAFAFCQESGIEASIKHQAIAASLAGNTSLRTDPRVSPTGLPFKVLSVGGTLSETDVYASRRRRCDLGYLRQPYLRSDESIGYRCPAEPIDDYRAKGGREEDAAGRKCLCNGLLAAIGLGQLRGAETEPAIVTAGAEVHSLWRFLPKGSQSYGVADVLRTMGLPVPAAL